MDQQLTNLPENHRTLLERFRQVCLADDRIVAAFLGGSYAAGVADSHSDLDLGLITTDVAYEPFLAERNSFVRRLGEPIFLEDFDNPHNVFFILSDGTEGEIAIGSVNRFNHINIGPYKVILDKSGILAGAHFVGETPGPDNQLETTRRLIHGFWHDLSHFVTAMERNQLWWAYGQMESLRLTCIDLTRLHTDFTVEALGYEKLEQAVSIAQLYPLQTTYCPMERADMLQAMGVIIQYFRQIAPQLAQTHGIDYPDRLAEILVARYEKLRGANW